jgi:hypothetical protein
MVDLIFAILVRAQVVRSGSCVGLYAMPRCFSPLFHASFHGAHKPARRPKHAAGAETLESRQALFAVVVFIDEFEFVLAKMEVL